jgi:rhodanese-related sulfurtransferase
MSSPETQGSAIDRLLAECRRDVDRVRPEHLAEEVAAGALVVDTRPVDQRNRDGELPGAVVVDRNVLEWRLDPTSPHRIPESDDANRRVIVVCTDGYSSSLARPHPASTRAAERHGPRGRLPGVARRDPPGSLTLLRDPDRARC